MSININSSIRINFFANLINSEFQSNVSQVVFILVEINVLHSDFKRIKW